MDHSTTLQRGIVTGRSSTAAGAVRSRATREEKYPFAAMLPLWAAMVLGCLYFGVLMSIGIHSLFQ